MKARMPGYISAKTKKAINDEIKLEWKKLEARKRREMAVREYEEEAEVTE